MRHDGSHLLAMAASPDLFRTRLAIDCDGQSRLLGDVLDDWQRRDFEALDLGLQRVAGLSNRGKLRAWLERPRGHSKTSDIAVSVVWLLFASRRAIKGVVSAADRDQADLLRRAIETLVRHNGWLADVLEIQRGKVINRHTNSECEILPADAASSYGLLIDFAILDEVAHWRNRDMFDSLFSAAAKRKNCLLLAITNAGFADSWQWELREAIRTDRNWYFSRLEGPQASWITADRLAEQRQLLPRIAFERLWLNRWGSGSGDAITAENITAAISGDMYVSPQKSESYVAGLDLGLSHDRSAFTIVGKTADNKLALRSIRVWRPPASGGKMDLSQIEDAIVRDHREFHFRNVSCDPWQCSHMVQRLRKLGVPVEERPQSGGKLTEQCMALVEAFRDGLISIPDDADLIRELKRVRLTEKSYGYRLESDRTADGHGDIISSLSIALATAKTIKHRTAFWRPLTAEDYDRENHYRTKISEAWAKASKMCNFADKMKPKTLHN